MKIPKYWIRREGDVSKPDGTALRLFAWGWSDTGPNEAETRARERFRSLEQRVTQGLDLPHGYAYGSRPVREQILQEFTGADGRTDALLTRNSYGAVVLNAARAMFVDVDAQPGSSSGFSLGRLFGGGAKPKQDSQLDRLRETLQSAWGTFRLYRTAGGFRLLATDRLFTPGSSDSETVMRQVGADPAFVQLCRIQDSFRARLTPKPWRVGHRAPPSTFPRDTGQQAAFDQWLQKYERAAASKATCQFIETIGTGSIHADLGAIVQLHDDRTRATSGLPLA